MPLSRAPSGNRIANCGLARLADGVPADDADEREREARPFKESCNRFRRVGGRSILGVQLGIFFFQLLVFGFQHAEVLPSLQVWFWDVYDERQIMQLGFDLGKAIGLFIRPAGSGRKDRAP